MTPDEIKKRMTPPGKQMLRSVCGWTDIFPGELPSFLQFVREIRKFNVGNLIDILSRTSCFYFHRKSQGQLLHIPPEHFPESAQGRLNELIKRGKAPIISRATILYLHQVAIRFGSAKSQVRVRERLPEFSSLLLLGAQYADKAIAKKLEGLAPDSPEAVEAFSGFFYSNLLLNQSPILATQLSRYWYFFMRYPTELNLQFDIRQAVSECLGIDPSIYIAVAFLILGHYLKLTDDEFTELIGNEELFPIRPELFRNIVESKRPTALQALDMLSGKLSEFRSNIRKYKAPKSGNDSKAIFDKPLIRLNDVRLPLDLGFLADQASFGLDYAVRDKLRVTDPKKQKLFSDAWGKIVEHHVHQLISFHLAASRGERFFIEEDQKTPDGCRADFILRYGTDLVFIEVSKSHVPPPRALSSEWSTIKPSIDRLLFRTSDGKRGKAIQLASAISDFKSGKLKLDGVSPGEITRIFPILILEHGIPQIPLVTPGLRKQIADESGLNEEAARFEFWDLEELEIVAPLLNSGLTELIHDKHSSGFADFPLKNFTASRNKYSDMSEYMVRLFNEAGKEMQILLFGHHTPEEGGPGIYR